MTLTARDAALRALIACRRNGAWSDGALKELLSGMDAREAALASRLCYGVLQNQALLDAWLAPFIRGKLQPSVRDILRLAVYQLELSDRIPDSAAVHEAVEQAKRFANPQAARLVNGVLRSLLRARPLPMPDDLSVRFSHPQELTELLLAQYGAEKTAALLESHNAAPETVLQVNTLLSSAQEVRTALERDGVSCREHPWLGNCLLVSGTGDMERLTAYREGLFYVQDAAARLAVTAAGLRPGMRVLDCCAAPGGKSFAAAVAMENRGEIISCDIHPHKLKLLENGAKRLHIDILHPLLRDAARDETPLGTFDAVLCDVPCSGLGVIRKKPDIRYRALSETERLPAIQAAILAHQAASVKPGGVLIYSTCTILRRENEAVAEAFLTSHPEFSAETIRFPNGSGIADAAMATLLPCDCGTDGFFMAKLRRRAD